MKGNDLNDILAECLDSMARGERTLEECLTLYPEHREELASLLRVAAHVSERAGYAPRPSFRLSSRARLLRRLPPRQPGARRKPYSAPPLLRRWTPVWTAVLALMVSLIGGGTVYASNDALPGDALYPVKLSVEDARLLLANDAGDAALASEFALKRLEEIQSLVHSNRTADLDLAVTLFSSRITTVSDSLEMIAQTDPDLASQLGLEFEQTLAAQTETLNQLLATVPEAAKPAIQHAISASSRGQGAVQNLIEKNTPPGGGPPENTPGRNDNPGGGSPEGNPGANPPGGGSPEGVPGNNLNPPGGPPHRTPGPPAGVPGGKP
jgi:hypothetical protein